MVTVIFSIIIYELDIIDVLDEGKRFWLKSYQIIWIISDTAFNNL
jgi:hypothetical protein